MGIEILLLMSIFVLVSVVALSPPATKKYGPRLLVVCHGATKKDSSGDLDIVPSSSNNVANATALQIERKREWGRKAYQAKIDKYGKQGVRELARKAYKAKVDKYGKDGVSELGHKAYKAKVDKYGEEGVRELNRKAYQAKVDKYGEEGIRELSRKAYQAKVDKYGEETIRETARKRFQEAAEKAGGIKAFTRKARQAKKDKNPLKSVGVGMQGGIGRARKAGKYTRYPGVRFRKDMGTWRVSFSYKGEQWCCGSKYSTEEEAALAHDEVVRKHKLMRPLHFPRENEISSTQSPFVQPKSALEEASKAAKDKQK